MALKLFKKLGTFTNDASFKRNAKEIFELTMNKNTDDLSLDEVNRLIYLCEQSAISYRRLLEESENFNDDFNQKNSKTKYLSDRNHNDFLKNIPISVTEIAAKKGNVLHIFAPFTFRKGMRDSFNLSTYVNAELTKLIKNHELNPDFFKDKKIIYCIRVSQKYSPARHRDNDNLELSEIINITFKHIGCSDNPLKMSFFSDFVISDDESLYGMHMIVAPYDMPMMRGKEWLNFLFEANA